jgi:hypothetical protein
LTQKKIFKKIIFQAQQYHDKGKLLELSARQLDYSLSSDADLKRELTSEALIRLIQKHNGAKNIFLSIHNFDKIL